MTFGLDLKQLYHDDFSMEWLYEPWFDQRSKLTLITGPAGSGKSFFSMALAVALATGKPFLGTGPGFEGRRRVLVMDLEMGASLLGLYTLMSLRGAEVTEVEVPVDTLTVWSDGMDGIPHGFHLGPRGHDEPAVWSDVLVEMLDRTKPDIVFIDPLVFLLGPRLADFDNAGTSAVLKGLRRYPHVQWVISHHESKTRETASGKKMTVINRSRGGTAIPAAVDRQISVSVGKDESRLIEFAKARGYFGSLADLSFSFRAAVDIAAGKARLERC